MYYVFFVRLGGWIGRRDRGANPINDYIWDIRS